MLRRLGRAWSFIFWLSGLMACGSSHHVTPSQPAFDAAHVLALDGMIEHGRAIVSSEATARDEIVRQLFYAIGYLNNLNGGPDMQRLELEIQDLTPRSDGRFDARYRAALIVAWPREARVPQQLMLVLPEGGDAQTLQNFFATYGNRQLGCSMANHGEEVSYSKFWYYYRPLSWQCPLSQPAVARPLAVRIPMRLAISAINTEGKFPEYGKVWEDGRLVVTAVFGKEQAASRSSADAGVAAAHTFHRWLRQNFGAPVRSNLPVGASFGVTHPSMQVSFNTPVGELVVNLELVDGIALVDEEFERRYGDAVAESDLVTYSGHSDLGANIRKLVRLGRIVPNQYRIFLINGCDSFSYVDDVLRDAHLAANPNVGPHKYFDLITNAMPSYFASNARSNVAVIMALLGKRKTYRQLLADFDVSQRPLVTGEEDNRWPEAF